MKLSPGALSLAMVALAAVPYANVSAFTVSDLSSSLSSLAMPVRAATSSTRLWTSMSTMNLIEEDEGEESETASSSSSSSLTTSKGPLAASTVTVTPVPKVAVDSDDVNVLDWDWESVAASVFEGEDQRPIVLFDGICNLCNGGVNFAMDYDPNAKLRFCSLQSKVARSLLMRVSGKSQINQIVLVAGPDQVYFQSEAVARICQYLDGLPPLQWMGRVGQVTPNFLREPIYKLISHHRYYFGETESCRLDFDGTLMSRFISDPMDTAEI